MRYVCPTHIKKHVLLAWMIHKTSTSSVYSCENTVAAFISTWTTQITITRDHFTFEAYLSTFTHNEIANNYVICIQNWAYTVFLLSYIRIQTFLSCIETLWITGNWSMNMKEKKFQRRFPLNYFTMRIKISKGIHNDKKDWVRRLYYRRLEIVPNKMKFKPLHQNNNENTRD